MAILGSDQDGDLDAYDQSASSVSAAGDVNGDDIGDLIIGAELASRGHD